MDKKAFLKQLAYELHKPAPKKFMRAKIIVNGINDTWACDLVDMQSLADENDGFKYMLNVVDCFSRYAWAVPLKSKSGDNVLNAFKEITKESGTYPKKLYTDEGKEFLNKKMKDWLKTNNIQIYHTYGESKASIVERFNRTLKTNMWKYFTEEQTRRWIDVLPDLIEIYNGTKHSSLGMSPDRASLPRNEKKLFKYQYGDAMPHNPSIAGAKFKLNDWVRVSKTKMVFEKGYTANWSHELFQIDTIYVRDPIMYGLRDYNGEHIKGSFYGQELQLTKLHDIFLIDKILDEKGKGKNKQYLVKWVGYKSPDFDSWITADQMMDLKE